MPDAGPSYDYPRAGYEQLLFKANGAGITVYSVAIATFLSGREVKIQLIAFLPFWFYFIGLIFGFFVYAIGMTIVEDFWRRKKRKEAMDLLEKTELMRDANPIIERLYQEGLRTVEFMEGQLLTIEKKTSLENDAARLYLYSGYSFIIGTLAAILCGMFAF